MELFSLMLFVSIAVFLFFYYFKFKFSYWKNLGVPFIQPRIPFGNIQGPTSKLHLTEIMWQIYNDLKHKGKFGGIYFITKPVIIVTDLDFLKSVLIKDFQYFHDRGMYYNVKDDPLSGHLFNIEGDHWKKLREKLTPTFTSGKIRQMVPTIVKVAKQLETFISKSIKINFELEIKEILARFTTDVIGTCAFGIECNSLAAENAKFHEMGLKVSRQPRNSFIKQIISVTYPDFARKIGIKVVRDDVSVFFLQLVKDVVEYRETNNVKRNDFMDLLLQLKKEGTKTTGELSVEEIAAQAFVFFTAGFETTSSTITFCLHELSLHREIQEKARKNVQDALARHDGKITYESLSEMTYLEQCINETLRKFPPASNMIRKVTKDYQVPDSNIVFTKGMTVLVSVYGIHHDPEIYPNPEEFDPDRFLHENVIQRHPMAFIPFGEGPRICIGMRFGLIETKIGLATLLSKFKFSKSSRTKIPLGFSKKSNLLTPENGLFLEIEAL